MGSLKLNGLAHPSCTQHSGDKLSTSDWRPVACLPTRGLKPGSLQSLFNVEDKHFIRGDKLPEPGQSPPWKPSPYIIAVWSPATPLWSSQELLISGWGGRDSYLVI